jgi:uncharacterized protein with ParB-like and HNH nuclease domain
MQKVDGAPRKLSDILNERYTIPYYQREYKWQHKQIEELIFDLVNEFKIHYHPDHTLKAVEKYGIYFLGPIIITQDNEIIDGQQRLTSLSLLLIRLNHLQKVSGRRNINIDGLIFSEDFGEKTFVIDEKEREDCLTKLYDTDDYALKDTDSEAIINIRERYTDVGASLGDEFNDEALLNALPHFIEWLKNKVYLIRIVTETKGDAHRVFENMNDRGLRLSSVEMIKGHLLSQVSDDRRNEANNRWKAIMQQLNDEKDGDINFVHVWLRSKYADSMRERSTGAEAMDFEQIFDNANKWLIENKSRIGIRTASDYERFIFEELPFFAKLNQRLTQYSNKLTSGFEYVFYNAHRDFNLQIQVIMSAVSPTDSMEDIDRKIRIISSFLTSISCCAL